MKFDSNHKIIFHKTNYFIKTINPYFLVSRRRQRLLSENIVHIAPESAMRHGVKI